MSSLKFQKFKDYEFAWVDAIIKPKSFADTENYATIAERSVQSMANNLDVVFSLHPMTKERVKEHKTVFVNEPKLSDLKQILCSNSIQAEFHGGVLVCNGIVALKKVRDENSM